MIISQAEIVGQVRKVLELTASSQEMAASSEQLALPPSKLAQYPAGCPGCRKQNRAVLGQIISTAFQFGSVGPG